MASTRVVMTKTNSEEFEDWTRGNMTNRSRGSTKGDKHRKGPRRSSTTKIDVEALRNQPIAVAIPEAPTEIGPVVAASPRPSTMDSPTRVEITPKAVPDVVAEVVPVDRMAEGQTEPMVLVVRPKQSFEDDRPTEIYDRHRAPDLHTTRDQLITGPTIKEMVNHPEHLLQEALTTLVERARTDLPSAVIDARASLLLRHEFEFDRRVGYRLQLKLYGVKDECIVVTAEVDHDGRAIRRGSMIAKLIHL